MRLFNIRIFTAMQIMLGFKFHQLYQQFDENIILLLQGCTMCCNTASMELGSFFFLFFFFKQEML